MTPGLAGFVAADTATQTWDEVIASVLAALGHEFTVVPDRRGAPAGTRRRTWLRTSSSSTSRMVGALMGSSRLGPRIENVQCRVFFWRTKRKCNCDASREDSPRSCYNVLPFLTVEKTTR